MMELAMKQKTVPKRIGSHKALSSVMRVSLILVIRRAHSATDPATKQPPDVLPCQGDLTPVATFSGIAAWRKRVCCKTCWRPLARVHVWS